MNNLAGKANDDKIGNYEEGVLMMMYDDVVITNKDSLLRDYRD
jgi:carbamoyl-phosphate synthase large subunit